MERVPLVILIKRTKRVKIGISTPNKLDVTTLPVGTNLPAVTTIPAVTNKLGVTTIPVVTRFGSIP